MEGRHRAVERSMLTNKFADAALVIAVVAGSFSAVTWYRAKAAAPPAFPTSAQLISAYHGTPGFQPFEHMVRGTERYVMLDVVPEGGDMVRFVHLQVFEPARTAPIVWTYIRSAVDCRAYKGFDDNSGETIEAMMTDKPRWGPYDLTPGSFETSGSYAACKYLNKL